VTVLETTGSVGADRRHRDAITDVAVSGGAPVRASAESVSESAARLALVRITRRSAVLITVVIAMSSFVLSFASLCDLAGRSTWPARLAWLWPLIVDGTIVLATMAIVALSAYASQRANRRFFWAVLAASAAVSLGGNVVHALVPRTAPLGPWLAGAIACVPPLALLGTTHALQVLWRFSPTESASQSGRAQQSALSIASARAEKWAAVAAAIHERGLLSSQPTTKITEVLRLAYDHQPIMSNRGIGQRVELHHDTVGKIKDAATQVLGFPAPAA
jgi:hypothetical protein